MRPGAAGTSPGEKSPSEQHCDGSHPFWGRQSSDQSPQGGPGRCRPTATGNRQFTSMTP